MDYSVIEKVDARDGLTYEQREVSVDMSRPNWVDHYGLSLQSETLSSPEDILLRREAQGDFLFSINL